MDVFQIIDMGLGILIALFAFLLTAVGQIAVSYRLGKISTVITTRTDFPSAEGFGAVLTW